ncbi:MAG: diaminopimelate epimerase [Mycoplasmataceae bacterium]|nr:diaminopimelate epimerase [Mycoplasmataceae bacterium]
MSTNNNQNNQTINFTKMHGLGNDYIYIYAQPNSIPNLTDFIIRASDRHFGVGSDGVIFITPSEVADFTMHMYNADGTQAEMCGNGIRCVGKYVYDKGYTNKQTITVETLAGIKTLELTVDNNLVSSARVNMGNPILEPNLIPVVAQTTPVLNLPIQILDRTFNFTCVSMGNPHCVAVINQPVKEFELEKYGPVTETDVHFPRKVNAEFVNVINRNNVDMRVWERGAGETWACGTGACAVAVACILNNLVERNVNIHLLGGDLNIFWDQATNNVYMTGPATTVFEGQLKRS